VKRPGREADHSPTSSAEVKEWVALHLHSPNTTSCRGAQLKHKENFIFKRKYYKSEQIKEIEMIGICSTHERDEKCIQSVDRKT
jgi:hypothetical protein